MQKQNAILYLLHYIGRIKYHLCLVILLFALTHLTQTGLFILGHFTENDDRNYMIKLDMHIWQNTDQYQRKIPRYIHQIWLSTKTNEQIYDRFRIAANICIELHSNYNYTLWTHEKIVNWLNIHYSWFLPIYKNYPYDMQRIDAIKYLLLFHFGGIYIDLDVKCNAGDLITSMIPLDKRENEPDIIFHMGTEAISANTDILVAKKNHPFFKLAVSQLKSANRWFYLYHLTIIFSAGPTYLHGIYRQFSLKENFYYIPNNLLYGKLIEGVGGRTWYGKDSLILIYFMENKILSICYLLIIIIIFIMGFKFLKKKRHR